MNIIKTFQAEEWSPALSNEEREHAISTLENGGVLYLPKLPFKLKADELPLLDTRVSDGKAKNISLRPKRGSAGDEFKGAQGSAAELMALEQMLKRYRANATSLVSQLFPAYMPHLITANTSYRPFEIAGRHSSYRKDDTRLHADSFPSNPTLGHRLLRVFSNINPEGRARAWRVGEPFEAMAEKFLPGTKPLFPGQSWLMHQLHITKKPRSEYDHLMLQLHDNVKADLLYQENCPQQAFDFPAGCTWIVYSDQVLHAAMRGQFLMEQTFHLPVEGLYNPDSSPLRILERMTGRSLIA